MIVSNTELLTVIERKESTIQSPDMPEGLRVLYLRTWPISPPSLRSLLDRMISQGMFFEGFRAWDNVLSIYEAQGEAAPERLFSRYVGETEGPKCPIDRQSEDEQGREYGVISAFLKAVEECISDVNCECKMPASTTLDK
ncbi:uncharacterized protein RHO25_010154 [Cercospora beticola]|uniref:Uncharacterized protein n=1 Tax=Cercospora beticola TaxID=122368 RepID=A0ABZ0P0X8_CERBT|nr:hypothetical protein RHO25_010154 [Cercospora beticola]